MASQRVSELVTHRYSRRVCLPTVHAANPIASTMISDEIAELLSEEGNSLLASEQELDELEASLQADESEQVSTFLEEATNVVEIKKRKVETNVEVQKTTPQALKRTRSEAENINPTTQRSLFSTWTKTTTTVQTKPLDLDQAWKHLTPEQRALLATEEKTMHRSWLKLLAPEMAKPYFIELKKLVQSEAKAGKKIFPPESEVYSWSNFTPLDNVKVVILGQDPYHNDGQAHGLCFSVRKGVRIPPSLVNIYKGLKIDIPDFRVPNHGYLENWAKEGVLMLNTCLTVRAHEANSHSNKGWEKFTDHIMEHLGQKRSNIVFMLWGKPAQLRGSKINRKQHLGSSSVSEKWVGKQKEPEYLLNRSQPQQPYMPRLNQASTMGFYHQEEVESARPTSGAFQQYAPYPADIYAPPQQYLPSQHLSAGSPQPQSRSANQTPSPHGSISSSYNTNASSPNPAHSHYHNQHPPSPSTASITTINTTTTGSGSGSGSASGSGSGSGSTTQPQTPLPLLLNEPLLDHSHLKPGHKAALLSYTQTINQYRENAKKTQNPDMMCDFAVFMVDAARPLQTGSEDEQVRWDFLAEAEKLLKQLAARGHSQSQYYLANLYASGMLSKKGKNEFDKAFPLYVQATKHHHPDAAYRAAKCYEDGLGARKDSSKAVQFYRKASTLNHPGAMYRLGIAELNGELGISKNPRDGVKWLKRAAEAATPEYPHALHELAQLHERGVENVVFVDHEYSVSLYGQAAELGYAPSAFRLGECYEYGKLGCPQDPALSIHYYTVAARQGHREACFALTAWYLVGSPNVLPQNDHEAYLWALKAAEQELPKAEYAIGYFSEVGIGCPKDWNVAMTWYKKAAEHGEKRAIARLEGKSVEEVNLREARSKKHSKMTSDDCVIM
ncbi:hypothetical protein BZG36_02545 [Bifiguratus adelaidae]|uniref:Uracil-DNA glycosylase n=1 Tax=Bifiguratus adelaidae TaxID=1938954 RepID=A0A261Y249_9FUNG|nr:hypothetical protein BZG36_02545 [Bifiguratus adelaidae]